MAYVQVKPDYWKKYYPYKSWLGGKKSGVNAGVNIFDTRKEALEEAAKDGEEKKYKIKYWDTNADWQDYRYFDDEKDYKEERKRLRNEAYARGACVS